MKNFDAFRMLMCAITAILFCGFGASVVYVRHFVNNAMEGKGHVTALVRSSSKNGSVFKPAVEFQTADGRRIEFTSSMGTSPPSYDVGESVTVYYDPENPHSAMLSGWLSLWFVSLIFAALAAVFGFITFVMFFRISFKAPRKPAKG
jgi:hypothetical protein